MAFVRIQKTGATLPIGKIVCVGQNYAEHVAEMNPGKARAKPNVPVIFLKPPSAVIHDGGTVVRPPMSREMHHEVELLVVLGQSGKNIARSRAWDHVLGYGVGLDLTLRDLQAEAKQGGKPWALAKGFDSSAVLSDIVLREEAGHFADLTFDLHVNGELKQSGRAANMIFPVDQIIEYVSGFMTWEIGDVLFTGTPSGVGPLHHGDRIEARLGNLVRVSADVVWES